MVAALVARERPRILPWALIALGAVIVALGAFRAGVSIGSSVDKVEGVGVTAAVEVLEQHHLHSLEKAKSAPTVVGVKRKKLEAIAECESHGNPRAVSSDGTYRGKYQFDKNTWKAMGGTGDPAKAPELEQDIRAAELYKAADDSPWPNCE
jgi:Transglycosylase-like domain